MGSLESFYFNYLASFFNEFFFLFNEMALYLLIGFFFAGVLHFYFPKDWILKRMGRSHFLSNLWASVFGIPLPLCSCGVVPTGLALRESGASKGSTVAFLTATPQTGVDSILVTYSFFGWTLSIFKVFAALISGILGGSLVDLLDSKDETTAKEEINSRVAEEKIEQEGLRAKTAKAFAEYVLRDQPLSLRRWLLIGIVVAAFISLLIPADLASSLSLGENRFLSYLIFLAIGVPMYICSTGSIPVAVALLSKGFPVGGIFVFLMAGPATNAASAALLYKGLGKKSVWIYILNITFCSLLFGWLFDTFFPEIGTEIQQRLAGQSHSHEHHSHWKDIVKISSSVLLTLLLVQDFAKRIFRKFSSSKGDVSFDFFIGNLSCSKCVARAEGSLMEMKGVRGISLAVAGEAQISFDSSVKSSESDSIKKEISQRMTTLGYEAKF